MKIINIYVCEHKDALEARQFAWFCAKHGHGIHFRETPSGWESTRASTQRLKTLLLREFMDKKGKSA